jgi:elongation factor G
MRAGGACMVYDSVGGVQPQSETVWRQASRYRSRGSRSSTRWTASANFFKVYDQMKSRLKANQFRSGSIGAEDKFEAWSTW